MHLLTDENGNPIPHGEHHHDHEHHHDEAHGHHHHEVKKTGDKSLALLSYMYDHNVHHTEELLDLAGDLEQEGRNSIAEKIRAAAEAFTKGNELLHEALHDEE